MTDPTIRFSRWVDFLSASEEPIRQFSYLKVDKINGTYILLNVSIEPSEFFGLHLSQVRKHPTFLFVKHNFNLIFVDDLVKWFSKRLSRR